MVEFVSDGTADMAGKDEGVEAKVKKRN
jgi:hypothetical protein